MVEPITAFLAAFSFLRGLWRMFKTIKKWFKRNDRSLYMRDRSEMKYLKKWFNDNHHAWPNSRPLPDHIVAMVQFVGQTTQAKHDEAAANPLGAAGDDDCDSSAWEDCFDEDEYD